MTGRATGQLGRGPKFVLRREFGSDFFLIRGCFPIHIENLVFGTKIRLRIAMAIQAPTHIQRRSLENERHLVDGTVTRGAADALVDVNAVIEVDVIGQAVDLDPLNRLVSTKAFANRFEIADIVEEDGMAIHAGLGGRNARIAGTFHAGMTVAAVDAVVSNMVLVAELYRLIAGNAFVGDIGGTGQDQYRSQCQSAQNNRSEQTKSRKKIRTTVKDLCHVSVALG